MNETASQTESPSNNLCIACGLCCTGHLFSHAKIKPTEIESTQDLGFNVFHSGSGAPAIQLPCHLWEGQCTIYTHPHKPSVCGNFECKLLQELEDEQVSLEEALSVVQQAKQFIQELEGLIPDGPTGNFRRLLFQHVKQLEQSTAPQETENMIRLKAGALFVLFVQRFGVTDLFNSSDRENSVQSASWGGESHI